MARSHRPSSRILRGDGGRLNQPSLTPTELRYGLPPKWWQTRRFQRALWWALGIVLTPVLAVTLVWLVAWVRDAYLTRQSQKLFDRCSTYVAPRGEPVFAMEAGEITRWVSPEPWGEWWPPSQSSPTVFLHGRRDRAPSHWWEPDRLVVLEVMPYLSHTYDGRSLFDERVLCLRAGQVQRPTTPRRAGLGVTFGSTQLVMLPTETDVVRILTGHPCPDDPSAFRFEVIYNGERQSVFGEVRGNLVLLKPEAGVTLASQEWRHAVFWIPKGATAAQEVHTRAVAASKGQPMRTSWSYPRWWTVPATLPSR